MPGSKQDRKVMEVDLESKLQSAEKERDYVKGQLDRERLLRVTNELIDTITAPEFVEKMRKARVSADAGKGMDAAADLLSIDSLRKAGVDIPKDFRMTSRVFEDLEAGVKIEQRLPFPGGPDIDPLGWGACGGAGGLSFCGCGGFST